MARQRTVLLSQVASGSGGPSSSTDVAYFDSNGKLTGDSGLTYTAGGGPLSTTGVFRGGNGLITSATYGFTSSINSGLYYSSRPILSHAGANMLSVDSAGSYYEARVRSDGALGFSSTNVTGTLDVAFGRGGSGILYLGNSGAFTDNTGQIGDATHRASNIFSLLGTFSSLVTFTTSSGTIVLKQGANGTCGTFVANGATPVTVTNSNVAISDAIIISLNTVGGTVGIQPHVATITAATGFTVVCTATDTSTYNYAIIKNAA